LASAIDLVISGLLFWIVGIDHRSGQKQPRIFADAVDQYGLSARIRSIRENPRLLPVLSDADFAF
jgi:hypothetical protein